jgi:hypothetical protein
MSTENVTVPFCGTVNDWLLMPMYLRWSNTLKSFAVWNGAALRLNTPLVTLRVSLTAISPSPKGFDHFWPYSASEFES